MMNMVSLGVLENITNEEMELAIKAIETDRKEKIRKAKIQELKTTLMETLEQIYELKGDVRFTEGGKYIPVSGWRLNKDNVKVYNS